METDGKVRMATPKTGYSDKDIVFLVETVDPSLLSKVDVIKNDPDIIEKMMEHEALRLFKRIMYTGEETITARITPRFLFEVLLRTTRIDMEGQVYTIERSTTQRIPIFDTKEVVNFLDDNTIVKYLADMLSSFTRIESYTYPVRVRKGIWRRVRFNDMDIDSLLKFCQATDEEHKFRFYKRIADLCLFILGMFPEHVSMDLQYRLGGESGPGIFGRLRRSAEDYEEEGRRFYRLAGEHRDAAILDLAGVLYQLHQQFNLAKKPLNYISEYYLQFRKGSLFPFISSN